jgi:small-conductance mechanosensitive channel
VQTATALFTLPIQQSLSIDPVILIKIIVIATVAIVLERLFSRQIRRFGKRVTLPLHVTNNIVLTLRLLLLVSASALIISLAGVPMEWLVAISAILGSAIGFASNKTIGNFIAGFFLLAARPFRVGDYVKIGAVEGVVEEIAINYTKILTMDDNIVAISNLQLLDRDITNYRCTDAPIGKTLYHYNFEMGFNHSVSDAKMAQIFAEVLAEHKDLPSVPTFTLDRTTIDGRFYRVFLYVTDPEEIFQKRNQIYEKVLGKWDAARLSD